VAAAALPLLRLRMIASASIGCSGAPRKSYDGVRTVMTTYLPVEQQLVVRTWECPELFLDQRSGLSTPPNVPQANVRVMVGDVDAHGLRDFTILDPDGFGLLLGSRLQDQPAPSSV
jgi:hypothetical protein